MNMKTVSTLTGGIVKARNCNQWYMFEFEKNVSQADKDFFGYNEGEKWPRLNSSGLLNGKKNIQSYPCNEVNKTVPYFKEFKPEVYK